MAGLRATFFLIALRKTGTLKRWALPQFYDGTLRSEAAERALALFPNSVVVGGIYQQATRRATVALWVRRCRPAGR